MRGDFTLAGYRRLLRTGLLSGYQFRGFDIVGREDGPRTCLLRHDVDSELWGCLQMADLEARLGVRATYFVMMRSTAYNLFCVESLRVVSGLLERGHHIGLHFMGELCQGGGRPRVARRALDEVGILEREFRTKIHSVSFHQPTKQILGADLRLGKLVNAYGRRDMRGYHYISDSNMGWRESHPAELLAQVRFPRMQLLIHPMWWTARPMSLQRKWTTVLRRARETLWEHWSAREVTLRVRG